MNTQNKQKKDNLDYLLKELVKDLNQERNELTWNDNLEEMELQIKDLLEEGILNINRIARNRF